MKTTEHQSIKPIGLARFLVSHGECAEGYETIRDRKVITVICRGCEASFSFLTSSPEGSRKEVEQALVELAEASGPERPARNGSTPERAQASPDDRPIHTPPAEGSTGRVPTRGRRSSRHRPLSPPGPFAPRHRIGPTPFERLDRSFQSAGRRLVAALDGRRRPIALAALALAGAYVLIGLSVGDEPSSSQGDGSLGGPQVPVIAPAPAASTGVPAAGQGSVAEAARPLQSFQAGGPEFQDIVVDEAQFRVALPADWGSSLGLDGRTLLGPVAGGAEIQVIARPRGDLSIGEMADEATASLAESVPPGHEVARLAAEPVGNVVQVARATTDSAVRTAYIGLGETTAYLIIEHLRNDASALVQMQTQGVVTSFEAD